MNNPHKSNKQLDELLDFICDLGALKFEKKIPLQNDGSVQDVIASSLNMLSEEWEETLTSKKTLEKSENRYKQLFEQSYDPLLMIRKTDQAVVDFNISASRFFHGSQLNKGIILNELFSFASATMPEINAALNQQGFAEIEDILNLDNGVKKYVVCRIHCLDVDGVEFLKFCIHDKTEAALLTKKNTNLQISCKYTEKQYKDLFEKASVGIVVVELTSKRLIKANEACSKILGYEANELVGMPLQDLIPVDKRSEISEVISRLNSEGQIILETKGLMKNGALRFVEISACITNDHEGKEIIVCYIRDIHEKKMFERQLTQNHRETLRYQSLLLSSQLSPHFVFNALNSVQYFVLDEKPIQTLDFVSNLAKLMRTVIENSRKDFIPLKEELTFLTKYLDLEKNRHKNKFQYTINVPDNINTDNILVPPMLLQPYIEYSVIHGVAHLASDGQINVTFSNEPENLIKCEIVDNGLGMEESRKMNVFKEGEKNHKSSSLNKSRIDILNALGEFGQFEVKSVNLEDSSGSPSGTKVTVIFPRITED